MVTKPYVRSIRIFKTIQTKGANFLLVPFFIPKIDLYQFISFQFFV